MPIPSFGVLLCECECECECGDVDDGDGYTDAPVDRGRGIDCERILVALLRVLVKLQVLMQLKIMAQKLLKKMRKS